MSPPLPPVCPPTPPNGWAARPNQFNTQQVTNSDNQPPFWRYWYDASGVAHACFSGVVENASGPISFSRGETPPRISRTPEGIQFEWDGKDLQVFVAGENVGFIRVQKNKS